MAEYTNDYDMDDGVPPDVRMKKNVATEENGASDGEKEAFDISRFLEGVDYPTTKEDIIDYAVDSGQETEVIDMLEQLPDTTYNSPTDVSQALGENGNI